MCVWNSKNGHLSEGWKIFCSLIRFYFHRVMKCEKIIVSIVENFLASHLHIGRHSIVTLKYKILHATMEQLSDSVESEKNLASFEMKQWMDEA